jgi:hypothetical protein
MRLPSLRFTVRRLMVAVAIAGIGLSLVAWMARRSATFHAKAALHLDLAFEASLDSRIDPRQVDYHGNLANKYASAARYPWLPVAPDQPEPE